MEGAAASKWAREASSDEEDRNQRKRKKTKRSKPSKDSPAFRDGSGTPSSSTGRPPRDADMDDNLTPDYAAEPAGPDSYYQGDTPSETARDQGSESMMPEYHITVPDAEQHPVLTQCRSVENYEKLNRISEGTYGVVYRARDRITGEIVALKKLKLDQEKNGFPITSLREVYTLLLAKHPHIVNVREIVVGDTLTQIFIVMDFIEHDLKELMSGMRAPFLQSEVKTLMLQLLSATELLHENWILHRDLKTSNLLLNNKGEIKVADFGLARRYGEPQGVMTQPVVTLWYRSPELLLGTKQYTTAVDMWSIGCIFAEFVNNEPLLPGRSEAEQLEKIFKLLGMPNDKIWPGFSKLPLASHVPNFIQPYNSLRSRFPYLTENGLDLMSKMLTYDPARRITAEDALKHPYFS
ncbi:Cyclin-dependent kinase 11B [Mortierella sp. NVP41]|nr:Cyclin-dependent kinase 11B [Mortierella sp. NVP41]